MKFNRLKQFAIDNNINLSDEQILQYEQFTDMLIETNKVMNLTAITDPEQIEIKHMIDSLEGARMINEIGPADFSLLDVGCGAGFPGIPLKIAYPENKFTLLDSLNKRINFVNGVGDKLGFKNFTGVAARAEDFKERESYDFVTSRAVARMNVLLEYCFAFVKVGGCCMLYKSGEFQEELDEAAKAISEFGGQLERIESYELPFDEGKRSLILIKKIAETPAKYPRRAGKPNKSPIK